MKKITAILLLICSLGLGQHNAILAPITISWAQRVKQSDPISLYCISKFVNDESVHGNISHFDFVLIFGTGTKQESLTPLIFTTSALSVNSTAFTAFKGYVGNGTSSYINTQWNPSTSTNNFKQNDAFIAYYCSNNAFCGATGFSGVCNNATEFTGTQLRATSAQDFPFMNDNSSHAAVNVLTTSHGLTEMARTSSTNLQILFDGLQAGVNYTETSTAIFSGNYYLLCANVNGTPSSFETAGRSYSLLMGGEFNSINNATLYTDIQNDLATPLGW